MPASGRFHSAVIELIDHEDSNNLYRQVLESAQNPYGLVEFINSYFSYATKGFFDVQDTDGSGEPFTLAVKLSFISTAIFVPQSSNSKLKKECFLDDDVVKFFRKNGMLADETDSVLLFPYLYEMKDIISPEIISLMVESAKNTFLGKSIYSGIIRDNNLKANASTTSLNLRFLVVATVTKFDDDHLPELDSLSDMDDEAVEDSFALLNTGLKPLANFGELFSKTLIASIKRHTHKYLDVTVIDPVSNIVAAGAASSTIRSAILEQMMDYVFKYTKNPEILFSTHFVDGKVFIRVAFSDDDKTHAVHHFGIAYFELPEDVLTFLMDSVLERSFMFNLFSIGVCHEPLESMEVPEGSVFEIAKITPKYQSQAKH
jgi:hypothetical protein